MGREDDETAIEDDDEPRGVRVGEEAPPVEAEVWIHSGPLPPRNARAVRILDFWNIFCGPCIANFPKQQAFWEEHRDESLEMICIHPHWHEPEIRDFLTRHPDLRLPIAIERKGSPVTVRYGIRANPTYVVIAPDGIVDFFGAGDWDGAQARALQHLKDLAKLPGEDDDNASSEKP